MEEQAKLKQATAMANTKQSSRMTSRSNSEFNFGPGGGAGGSKSQRKTVRFKTKSQQLNAGISAEENMVEGENRQQEAEDILVSFIESEEDNKLLSLLQRNHTSKGLALKSPLSPILALKLAKIDSETSLMKLQTRIASVRGDANRCNNNKEIEVRPSMQSKMGEAFLSRIQSEKNQNEAISIQIQEQKEMQRETQGQPQFHLNLKNVTAQQQIKEQRRKLRLASARENAEAIDNFHVEKQMNLNGGGAFKTIDLVESNINRIGAQSERREFKLAEAMGSYQSEQQIRQSQEQKQRKILEIIRKNNQEYGSKPKDTLREFYDSNEQVKNYLAEKDSVKNLDTFEMKVAPTALQIFAENLNSRVKSLMFTHSSSSSQQPFAKKLKILSPKSAAASQANQHPSSSQSARSIQDNFKHPSSQQASTFRREPSQASVNMTNLNLIIRDPGPAEPEKDMIFDRKKRSMALEADKSKRERQQREIEKYMSMDTKDLYSEEARKQLIKFKVYRPKSFLGEGDKEELLRQLKTTNAIATEQLFEVRVQKQKPECLKDDELVATQMDLYVTMNLNENLHNARVKRKKDRTMEAMASKMTKINGFVDETFKTDDIAERIKIESEVLQEFKQVQQKIEDLRVSRTKLFAVNTSLHNQLQMLKQQNKQFEEELKRNQISSKSNFESKVARMGADTKAGMIKDFVKMNAEREMNEKIVEQRKKKEQAILKARDQNQERIFYVEKEMEVHKSQLLFLVNVQKEHYLRLLKEGKDTRQKGLLWIIQCLKSELEVPLISKDMMPSVIDDRSKQFIMELADKDFALVQLQQRLQDLKQSHKLSIINEHFTRSQQTFESSVGFASARSQLSSVSGQTNMLISSKGFIPIRPGENFQKIMDLKNSTLREIWKVKEEAKKLNLDKQHRTITQILDESNKSHSKAFGFQSSRNFEFRASTITDLRTLHPKTQSDQGISGSNLVGNAVKSKILSTLQGSSVQQYKDEIEGLEAKIKVMHQDIEAFKMQEIKRLVKDYQNHYSELRKCLKSKEDLRKLFLCLFGDTSLELEFKKMLISQTTDKKGQAFNLVTDI